MKTDELIKALGRLKVQTGSLACLGCGHEHNCGVHGCAIAREAAVRLSLYEHALEQVAKERDTLLAQLKRFGGCMGFELRESNMKKYAPERLGEYVHTIRVTLMQDDYTGHIAYEVGGNCKGGDLLDPNGVLEGDYLFTENDCRFRCVDEEMPYFEAMLHNAAGDALMVEGDENDMLDMIVSMEIADVRKVGQYESNP